MSEKQFSKEDLASFAAAIVSEMRKPEPQTDAQKAELQLAQQQRLEMSASVKQKNENKRFIQEKVCTHEHLASAGGGTHCVYVHDNGVAGSPGYIYCQKCEGRVRPDEPLMRKLDPNAIFDNFLYNKLLQSCVQTGAEILG